MATLAPTMDILRFTTVGSVDDGKSTLIGRLLFDTNSIFEDQIAAVAKTSERKGHEGIDLALVTDGLAAEREQGITIDVAYRYFSTPKRRFIIADTPGHKQYTRNMVTGASTADLTIILVDARKGLLEQSRRHAFISSLLGIPNFVVAVNKMDLVNYDQATFDKIVEDFKAFTADLNIKHSYFVPISALKGHNVAARDPEGTNLMPWYQDETVLDILEGIDAQSDINFDDFRLPVQYVIREDSADYQDFRGFAGQIASGVVRVGDEITSLPSKQTAKVKSIASFDGDADEAAAPQSITLVLDQEIDTSRGDTLVHSSNQAPLKTDFSAHLCWMSEQPLKAKGKYSLKLGTAQVKAMVSTITERINTDNLSGEATEQLELNDIAKVEIKLLKPLPIDSYADNRATGRFILIDEVDNNTVAAGMIL